jgi:hypothetical protein
MQYRYVETHWFPFNELFPFVLNYRCTNSFHDFAKHVDIDIDIDIDIPFFCSKIIGKFYFLHVENATEFVPEMESILLENEAVIINDCTNGLPASVTQVLRS